MTMNNGIKPLIKPPPIRKDGNNNKSKKDIEKFKRQIEFLKESVLDDDSQIVGIIEKRLIKMYEEA